VSDLTWLERVWIEVQNEIDYETRHPQGQVNDGTDNVGSEEEGERNR
jgi:hypothetical protein